MDKKKRDRLLDAVKMLNNAAEIVSDICDKEQDCMDNYPENLQGTDTYEKMETAVDSLTDAIESLDDTIDSIKSAIE